LGPYFQILFRDFLCETTAQGYRIHQTPHDFALDCTFPIIVRLRSGSVKLTNQNINGNYKVMKREKTLYSKVEERKSTCGVPTCYLNIKHFIGYLVFVHDTHKHTSIWKSLCSGKHISFQLSDPKSITPIVPCMGLLMFLYQSDPCTNIATVWMAELGRQQKKQANKEYY